MDNLSTLVDAALSVEKLRVAAQVRQSHLALQTRTDPDTDVLVNKLTELEAWVDGRVAVLIKDHPAYPWFSRVKGIGKENIGKVVGQVRVKPERGWIKQRPGLLHPSESLDMVETILAENVSASLVSGMIEVDLPYADTISALWKFCGFSVENGHAPKRVQGEKLSYNSNLRSMCWRLAGSLLKANGKFKAYYDQSKAKYVGRYTSLGVKIVPAAKLPRVNGKKQENEQYISEGHIHNMALRRMMKLFLSCLWLSWRAAEGLSVTTPYAFGPLGHAQEHIITPEMMTDR